MSELHNKKRSGVPSTVTKWTRGAVRRLATGTLAGKVAELRAQKSGKPVRKILIFSDRLSDTSEQQIQPLVRYRQTIAAQLGYVFEFRHTDRITDYSTESFFGYHAVGLKLIFNVPAPQAEAVAKKLFDAARSAGARCLVFDGDDDLCVLWPGVIDACDVYIKKHRFKDLDDYSKGYVGKSNLTDYVHNTYGVDFEDDIITETLPLNQDQIDKISLGWNIALDQKIYDLSRDVTLDVMGLNRKTDISCRASYRTDIWMYGMRNSAVKILETLVDKYRIHSPTSRVSQVEYYHEVLDSRFVVSPFGCGELCWRDFEAILCGSVLIKPDMSHIETWPNLFLAGETYVPVAWDYSDLEDACTPLLNDETARLKMAEAARAKLLAAFTPEAFLERVDYTMKNAGVSKA